MSLEIDYIDILEQTGTLQLNHYIDSEEQRLIGSPSHVNDR